MNAFSNMKEQYIVYDEIIQKNWSWTVLNYNLQSGKLFPTYK